MLIPKLSIITINYNNAAALKKTIESIVSQSYKEFEYIVIDGGSADDSLDIIKAHENKISRWVSEKDNGIYNAMNKGIQKANGEYILFVNSGDYLFNKEILKNIAPELTGEDIIYGDLLIEEPSKTWEKKYPDNLNFTYFVHDSLPHSGGIFIQKKAFTGELAKYDESLKIVSDWKWFLEAIFKHNYTYKHINKVVGVFEFTGVSATNPALLQKEKKQVLINEFREIYREISMLSDYKTKYETLYNSGYIKLCLRLKKLTSWQK